MYTENDGKMNPPDFSVVKSRKSYLPAGTKWIDFWTGETFEGGQNVEKQTPIDIMPLYIKAGSVIPMGEFVQYANEKKGTVELRIYPGADAHFVLYDDERDNYNYEKGEYATIDLQWNDAEKKLTIGEKRNSIPLFTITPPLALIQP
jgi:alpha-D-xyloside xylohydrolase